MIPIQLQYKIDKIKIGRRLRKVRICAQLTQEKLAEAIGVTSKYLSKMENGAASPSLQFIIKFAEVTGCDLNYLLMGIDPKGEGTESMLSESFAAYGDPYARLSKRGIKIYGELTGKLLEILEKNNI